MRRRWFIMDMTQAQPEDVLAARVMCIGNSDTQRENLANTELFIKTTQNAINVLLAEWPQYTWEEIMTLTFCVELTEQEAHDMLALPTWTETIPE